MSAVRARREAGVARRQLTRELRSYSTPSELNDLLALIDDRDDAESARMREILLGSLRRCA